MSLVLTTEELINELNPEQKKAVLHEEGPAIVLAGAGSGKTRVLTTRVAYLIQEKKIPSQEILLVTFTNKAAAEMKKRVFDFTGQKLMYSGTFHSLSAKILRIEASKGHLRPFGLNENFTIYDSNDQLALIKNIYKVNSYDTKEFKPQAVKAKISQAKNQFMTPKEYAELAGDSLQNFASKIYKIYQRRLQEENAVDFDDLLNLAYQLLVENDEIRQKYQNRFQYVLVDEFQDSNRVQYLFTKILAKPQNNLFAVGDFSQSIYAWRGADYRNLNRLIDDFPEMKEYRLERNYRSTQNILDAATQVIRQNNSHPVLELWTDQNSEEKLDVYETSSSELEAEKVAQIISRNYLNRLSEIAVLYRTNVQSRSFEEAFMRHHIPYQLIGGVKFYERKEVKDFLAYMRLCFNPSDSPSLDRTIKLGKRRFAQFQSWLSKANEETLNNPFLCLEGIKEATDYLGKFKESDPDDLNRLDNIQELLAVASQFADSRAFLENVALVQDGYLANQETGEFLAQKVSLMSFHSAKGLEFPIVFMVGMEEGLLPHSRSLFSESDIEEERRLCYVGITRAKEKLYFSYARNRFTYGYSSQCTPSRFLSEISQELINLNRSFDQESYNPYKKKKKAEKKKDFTPKRKIVIDEDSLDALLNDEMDIKDFLKS